MTGQWSLAGEFAVGYYDEDAHEQRRVTYEHLDGERWLRVEHRQTADGWKPCGRSVVRDLDVSPVDERRE